MVHTAKHHVGCLKILRTPLTPSWQSCLNVDGASLHVWTGEILKDTVCYHSRIELKKIMWNLQSFYLFRQTLSPLKNSALFQKSQRRLCVVLFFWYNKARLKVKFWKCYPWMNTLFSVEFWNHFSNWFKLCCEESFRDIWQLLCSKPVYSSSRGGSH